MRRRNLYLDFGTDDDEFAQYVGGAPSKSELDEWVTLLEQGVHWSIDWDVLCENAAQEFRHRKRCIAKK